MSVEKSVLTKNDIITLLRTQYNIEGNVEITKLNRGSSNLFKINVNGKRYILKEFNSNKPVSLVEKEKFFVPPSALKPYATAIASSKVDLPVPFSPTKKVILEESFSSLLAAKYFIIGKSFR